jgi:hypothetical protein
MAVFNKNQVDLIDALSELYTVILISDSNSILDPEFYVVGEYRTPTNDNKFLTIRNFKRITDIVKSNSLFINDPNSLGVIVTQIDNMSQANRERVFCDNFNWIKF